MPTFLMLIVLVVLAKVVLIDSPVGAALGDVIRSLAPSKAPQGAASSAELENLRLNLEELHDRLERVEQEQEFLTRLLTEPKRLSMGPGEAKHKDL